MKVTKRHIAIGFAISIIIGLLILAFYLWRKKKSATTEDLIMKVDNMTMDGGSTNGIPASSSIPSMYGAQNVVQDQFGIWKLAPGTCNLVTTGIVDWETIKNMTQIQKDQLFEDLGNCKGENIPLIQPNYG